MAEMLLQSQNGEIHLLPSLPLQWKSGAIKGLRARGACTVNIEWKDGQLSNVLLLSDKGGKYTIRYKEKTKQVKLVPGKAMLLDGLLN